MYFLCYVVIVFIFDIIFGIKVCLLKLGLIVIIKIWLIKFKIGIRDFIGVFGLIIIFVFIFVFFIFWSVLCICFVVLIWMVMILVLVWVKVLI